ncbi:hypothetical protein LINGRAHAP2_LOCUS15211, partial [Linum grandiflorum]
FTTSHPNDEDCLTNLKQSLKTDQTPSTNGQTLTSQTHAPDLHPTSPKQPATTCNNKLSVNEPLLTRLHLSLFNRLHKPPIPRFIIQLDLGIHPYRFAVPRKLSGAESLRK